VEDLYFSFKRNLKATLLHNDNKHASHPAHSKETYENQEYHFKKVRYKEYGWILEGDLKVITIPLGRQYGHIKMPCSSVNGTAEHEDCIG
jgi:hypothetical protein